MSSFGFQKSHIVRMAYNFKYRVNSLKYTKDKFWSSNSRHHHFFALVGTLI